MQVLLTTLLVKLTVMAALATMLVRYRRFRHILIFERRGWPDRLAFALGFGIPLSAGVLAPALELGILPDEPGEELAPLDALPFTHAQLARGVRHMGDEELGHIVELGRRCGRGPRGPWRGSARPGSARSEDG